MLLAAVLKSSGDTAPGYAAQVDDASERRRDLPGGVVYMAGHQRVLGMRFASASAAEVPEDCGGCGADSERPHPRPGSSGTDTTAVAAAGVAALSVGFFERRTWHSAWSVVECRRQMLG